MKPKFPPISAASPAELRSKLASIEIRVVRRPARRTHASRERYSAARMLATLCESNLLVYPLVVQFRNGPDVALHMPTGSIGVECTDAIAHEWNEILDLRARSYPDAIIFLPRLKPDARSLSDEELQAYACGTKSGPPWLGDSVEKDWAQAISYFAGKKLEKLRAGAYSDYSDNWLLIHDEWVMHPVSLKEHNAAISILVRDAASMFSMPCFSRVLVEGNKWLTNLTSESREIIPIVDLWRD